MESNYKELIGKLERFRRKYYKNQIIRGFLILLGIAITALIISAITEYFVWNNSIVRAIILYFYCLIIAVIFSGFIIWPLLQLLKIVRGIDYYGTNALVRKQLPEIKDKLINALQLAEKNLMKREDSELLIAALNQKILNIKPLPIANVIKYGSTLKRYRLSVFILFLFVILMLAAPHLITKPASRIINYNQEFVKPMPYEIHLVNNNLYAIQNEDFEILALTEGYEIPEKLFLEYAGIRRIMKSNKKGNFSYIIPQIQEDLTFRFTTEEFSTNEFKVSVYPRPVIIGYEIRVSYPEYTGIKSKVIENVSKFSVNEGSVLDYIIYTMDAGNVVLLSDDKEYECINYDNNSFKINIKVEKSFDHSILARNSFHNIKDSLHFDIVAIPDQYPAIQVEMIHDSSLFDNVFFSGYIEDDFGFTDLVMCLQQISDDNLTKEANLVRKNLVFSKEQNKSRFFNNFNFDSLAIEENEKVIVWFEVFDNDEHNGFKKTESNKFEILRKGIADEMDKIIQDKDLYSSEMESTYNEIKFINEKLDEMIRDLLEKPEVGWEDRNKLSELVKKQEELMKKVEREENDIRKQLSYEKRIKKIDDRILEKQKK